MEVPGKRTVLPVSQRRHTEKNSRFSEKYIFAYHIVGSLENRLILNKTFDSLDKYILVCYDTTIVMTV